MDQHLSPARQTTASDLTGTLQAMAWPARGVRGNITVADVLPLLSDEDRRGIHGKAMLECVARFRLNGIHAARKQHDDRRDMIAMLIDHPRALAKYLTEGCVMPLLSVGEAAAFWTAEVRSLRQRLDEAVRQNRLRAPSNEFLRPRVAHAAEHLIVARFFRRYGKRIAIAEAAS